MKKFIGINRGNCSTVHGLMPVVAATVLLFAAPLFADPGGRLSDVEHRVLYRVQKAVAKKDYPVAEKLLSDQLAANPDTGHYLVPFMLGNVLSMTGDPKIFEQGASLIVGVEGKKPSIVLVQSANDKEGIEWASEFETIAKIVP